MLSLYRKSYSGLQKEVWILALVMLINRTGAMLMPFLTIIMTEGRGFSLREAGYMMSAFGLGSMLGSWLGGRWTDRVGFYPIQLWSLVFTGVAFITLVKLNGLITITLGIFVLSAIADAFRPANQAAIVLYSLPENLTRSFGLQRLAFNLGYAVGPALGGLMIVRFGHDAIFYMSGIGYLISALLLWWLLPEPVREVEPQADKEGEEGKLKDAVSPWRDWPYLRFLLFNFLAATGFFQLISSIPAFWKTEQLFSEFQIGLFMGLNGLLIVLIEMPLLYLIESDINKQKSITAGALLFAVAYTTLIFVQPPWLAAIVYIWFISIGEILYMPFASSLIGKKAPRAALGSYLGLYGISWSLAIIIAPSGGLYLAERWGFHVLWYTSMLLCSLAAIGIARMTFSEHSAPE